MTISYRIEAQFCHQPRATTYEIEDSACMSAAASFTGPNTPWADGSWWVDHDGRLVGWGDFPSPEEVVLANLEAGIT